MRVVDFCERRPARIQPRHAPKQGRQGTLQ